MVLLCILYHFLKSYFNRQRITPGFSRSEPEDDACSWFAGFCSDNDDFDLPPPYSMYPSHRHTVTGRNSAWQSGFWTGSDSGEPAGRMLVNSDRQREALTETEDGQEHDRTRKTRVCHSQRWAFFDTDDHEHGSSSLGTMRQSTGFGGSTVR